MDDDKNKVVENDDELKEVDIVDDEATLLALSAYGDGEDETEDDNDESSEDADDTTADDEDEVNPELVEPDEGDDEDEDETDGDDGKEDDADETAKKEAQSKEERAKFAQRRREAEARAKEKAEKLKGILSPFGVKSYAELEKLESAFSAEKVDSLRLEALNRGIDEDDYIERQQLKHSLALMEAQIKAKQAADEHERALSERAATEISEFRSRYPAIEVAELMKNKRFVAFGRGRLGGEPLLDIFTDYLEFDGERADKALQRSDSKAQRSTGTGKSAQTVALSAGERQMLNEWNAENPDNQMSDKEFYKRKRSY